MLACLVQDAANRGSVKNVQVKGSNSNWETLNNVWGASWETGQVPATPLDFRIQDDQGVDVGHPLLSKAVTMHEAAGVCETPPGRLGSCLTLPCTPY